MAIIRTIIRLLLWLRYRISIRGIDEILAKGTKRILFLPNHPALIDPIILSAYLHKDFKPRPIAYETQIDRPVIRNLARAVRALTIPDTVEIGVKAKEKIENVLKIASSSLMHGDNILLYPAGHLARSRFENLGASSAVEKIIKDVSNARIVLVRTRGLWGSSFGHGSGEPLRLKNILFKGIKSILLNGIIFAPRRRVYIEFHEPENFPRTGTRFEINRFLEEFYNKDAYTCTYVPYTIWEKGGIRTLPEPVPLKIEGDINKISDAVRKLVTNYLRDISGIYDIKDSHSLANDLGFDSLARAELILWISREFGFQQGDTDSIQTVADCFFAASGSAVSTDKSIFKPVKHKWFKNETKTLHSFVPVGDKITEVFLKQFKLNPNSAIIADQNGGVRTYRQLVAGIMALRPVISKIPKDRIGIMLPASTGAVIVYLAVLFSSKTPVMINWTQGRRSLLHCVNLAGVDNILTSRLFINALEAKQTSIDFIVDKFIFLEDIRSKISGFKKISALAKSYISWRTLQNIPVKKTAVILFTSGSENLPKAVPLTHLNILANIRDVVKGLSLYNKDRIIGMLPPFHSFGLTGTLILPLCAGIKTVYHPDPTEAYTIARLIEAYKVSVLVGTPTFLNGIASAAKQNQLASLKLAFSGAEKCPESVYSALKRSCPQLKVLEGYGITECSPVVSYNRPEEAKPYTIGKVIDSAEYAIVDLEANQRVKTDNVGMLLVRGPSIFNGYLNYDGKSPFIRFEDKLWYKTGDLVKEDEDRILTFCGRLKRFIKLGGEMISLPAIETVLNTHFKEESKDGPVIAVEADSEKDNPEIVLFTTIDLDRNDANKIIRDGGLSPLHNIRRIIKVDVIPVLGTGKTDYRRLKECFTKF